jgi:predicted GNAT family acetyltransferase
MPHQVRDAKERHRFELEADGHVAFSTYRREAGVVTIMHTEVPKELGGRGIGTALAHGLLELIRAEGAKVTPLCPFVKAYIDKHPEYADLVAP